MTASIPSVVIKRLPIYLRALRMLKENGQEFTSSHELGRQLGIGSAQIRRDLAHFGEFGKQGTGYEVSYLHQQISKILNVDRSWSVALIGFGDLGQALSHYSGFARKGFHIDVIFDNNPAKIGQKCNGKIIQDYKSLTEVIPVLGIQIAILAVPASAAQKVANDIIKIGIRAILNYAPVTLFVPDYVKVQYIDPIAHLQHMAYYLTQR